MILGLLLACATPDGAPQKKDAATEAPTLPEVDLSGTEPGTFVAALERALALQAGVVFAGHQLTLDEGQPGCPDKYLGEVDEEDIDGGAVSWVDYCQTAGGQAYEGHLRWEGTVAVEGDPSTPEGQNIDAERQLEGNATVKQGDALRFEFVGDASESLSETEGDGYRRWTWSSEVDASVGGSAVIDPSGPTPDGWRVDLLTFAVGGNETRLEVRGNAYWFGPHLAGRFDSVDVDLEILGAGSAGPDDCLQEPRGHLSIRDGEAVWYDLVFLPRTLDDLEDSPWPNDPLSVCDGCGTLYVRGVPQGEVCPDLMQFADGRAEPPTVDQFVFPLRSP
ncbi:MAG: hypothetical protein ACI8PZ_004086 [Myxococcota bacterium]|jgi:hypothetical protein